MSYISIIHYIKLIFRSCLFVAATILYVASRAGEPNGLIINSEHRPFILVFIWFVFVIEMFFRFFPSRVESMGCQKQFKRSFSSTKRKAEKNEQNKQNKSALIVAVLWIMLNCIIGVLHHFSIIDDGILVLTCLAFSVCDMICILFFCPFQTLIMKNKCCTSCRIYNWDYAMMFTPLIFTKDIFAIGILLFAIILLVRWEITLHIHPERFSERTNECLSCSNCKEKLCSHKKQLRRFLAANKNTY